MRKIISLLLLALLVLPGLPSPSAAVERSLGNMNVPVLNGIDTLGLGVPTLLQRSIGRPNVPLNSGLAAELTQTLPKDDVGTLLRRPVQYNCKFDCHNCREGCAVQWKGQCVGAHCRKGFSDCMKACWNAICRNCR